MAKNGRASGTLIVLQVSAGGVMQLVEHWGEMPAAEIPQVGDTVCLPVSIRTYVTSAGYPAHRLRWARGDVKGEAF